MRIRVVLLPDENLKKIAEKYSAEIAGKFPVHFKLDENHLAHATVFVGEFQKDFVAKLINAIKDFTGEQKRVPIKISKIVFDPGNITFLSFVFVENKKFLDLRMNLIEKVKSLAEGELEHLYPHITLNRLKEEKDVEGAINLFTNLPDGEFDFEKIVIAEDGENGTVNKILVEFNLK